MRCYAGIEAQLAWGLLFPGDEGVLGAPAAQEYAGVIEGLEAAELLKLITLAQQRLAALGEAAGSAAGADNGQTRATRADTVPSGAAPATELYIDRDYRIRLGSAQGTEIPFRPLVRALFILFLKHPEGILLKERERFQEELAEIYAVVAPNVSSEDRKRRVSRLTDLRENAFSENLSVLNATLDRILPAPQAGDCKVQGYNGHPRRIPLSPLLVHWAG